MGTANEVAEFLVVIHLGVSGVERHDLKLSPWSAGSGPGDFTPRAGRVYANYPELGGLSRWDGDHFEAASQDEKRIWRL